MPDYINGNTTNDLVAPENPDGKRPAFSIGQYIGALKPRKRRAFIEGALTPLTVEMARELARVDYEAEIRVRQASVSEIVDSAYFESRSRLARRIAPDLFSAQRYIFAQANAVGLGRNQLERTLVGLGLSALQMLLLGGLPRDATAGQETLIDGAFRTMDMSRGPFEEEEET